MNKTDADMVERAIAAVIATERRRREYEIAPLMRRLDLLEQRLDLEQRMASIERRFADADGSGPVLSVPHLRSVK
jgi:hypothetical protein